MTANTKNVPIRKELHERLKQVAKENRHTMKVLIEDGIEWAINQYVPKAKETAR